jgi:hypothetical protein
MGATTPLRFLSSNKGEQVDGIPIRDGVTSELDSVESEKFIRLKIEL